MPESEPLPAWADLKKPKTSFFAYGMGDGQCWVVMESASHAGCFIVPIPEPFESWDEALPPSLGRPDIDRQLYVSYAHINTLSSWFASRQKKGTRIDSNALEILQFSRRLQA